MEKTININTYTIKHLLKLVNQGETITCVLKDEPKMKQLVESYRNQESASGLDEEDICYKLHKNIPANLISFQADE